MSQPVPDVIGPYPVVRPIARGGMAEVFEVEDPASGERRALKLLVELKTSLRRFQREFEAMTRLNHPGIVRVYRYGLHEGRQPWMSMEMLDGRPLQERMAEMGAPGTPDRTLEVYRIGYLLAGALQYIHDRGLVHRDLKSANIQVLRDGRIKLLDFGTAHLTDPLDRITQEGDFVGTFSYAAPEQIIGSQVDHRADIYAFGVLLYRLLTGRRPFKSKDPHEIARMHLQDDPEPIGRLVPSLPKAVEDLVSRMMAKKRTDRPDRVEEVGKELERVAGQALGLPGFGLALYDDRSVGRSRDHRRLWQAVGEGVPGHCVVVHGGDAGERTRFVQQVGRDASRRGWTAIGCGPGVDPAAELAHALSLLVVGDDHEAGPLRDILEGPWGPRIEVLRPLLPVVVARIAAAGTPILMAFDQLSEFGALEVEVIGRLAREARKRQAPLQLVVAAEKLEDVAVASVLKRAQSGTKLELGALDARRTGLAVAELLHRRPPPPGVVRHLTSQTAGEPTLLRAVVGDYLARGDIRVRGSGADHVEWGVADDPDDALPEVVLEILEGRLSDLSVPEIRALEVLAISGGETATPVIARALGIRTEQVDILLRGLVDRGLIHWEGLPASPVSSADALLIRWLDETVTPVRRVVVQGLVADAVEMQAPSAAQVRVLIGVGRYGIAVERGMTVASAHLRRGRAADAVELLELLEPHLKDASIDPGHRIRFLVLYAACLLRVKPMDPRAARALDRAEQIAGDGPTRAFVAFERSRLFGALGHYANQVRALEEAWDELKDGEPSRLRGDVSLELGEVRWVRGELREARTWFDTAVRDARSTNDREVYDRGRIGQARLMLTAAEVGHAEQLFREVMEAEKNHPDPTIRHHATAGWGQCLRWSGRWSEAVGPLAEALAEARMSQSVASWVALAVSAANIELDLFRLGRAQEFIEEVLQALGPGERLESRMQVRMMQGRITLASGQLGSASFQLAEVADQADKAGLVILSALARSFLAESLLLQGAEADGREHYKRAMLALMTSGDRLALADAVISRSRAVGVQEDPKKVFLLVSKLPQRELVPLLVEQRLATMRWAFARGERAAGRLALDQAQETLDDLVSGLDVIEQSAMRVHPWTHELRRTA